MNTDPKADQQLEGESALRQNNMWQGGNHQKAAADKAQEWTIDTLKQFYVNGEIQVLDILYAHNASIAAELEELRKTQEAGHAWKNLAETYLAELKQLREQLAEAQAAMKSAEALLHDYVIPADVRKFLLSGDTAALDAVIAAATKLLVDALTNSSMRIGALRSFMESGESLSDGDRRDIANTLKANYAALAQVKEGK